MSPLIAALAASMCIFDDDTLMKQAIEDALDIQDTLDAELPS